MQSCQENPVEIDCGEGVLSEEAMNIPPIHKAALSKASQGVIRFTGLYEGVQHMVHSGGQHRQPPTEGFPCGASELCVDLRQRGSTFHQKASACSGRLVVVEGWFDPCHDGRDPGVLGEICLRSIRVVKEGP